MTENQTAELQSNSQAEPLALPKARIRVTSGYSGQRIRGAYIPEGDYDIDDARLLGQSEFLLASGRAVHLDAKGNPSLAVTAGQVDRDLAGKPVVVPVGQDQGHLSNTVAPVFAQFPNNASASEVIQPYETGSTEPAAVAGSEHKLAGTVSAKPEAVARQEAAATHAATEAEAAREHAGETDGEATSDEDYDTMSDEALLALANERRLVVESSAREDLIAALQQHRADGEDVYSQMTLEALREEAKARGIKPLDADGNEVAISRAKRASLEAALRASE